jgi:hypothetical protein
VAEPVQHPGAVAGVRSHEELIVWKLSNELKLQVYSLLKKGPVMRDLRHLRNLWNVWNQVQVPLQVYSQRFHHTTDASN